MNDMRSLYMIDKKERPSKPIRHWLNEEIEVSKRKACAFVATCLAVGSIAGYILWKLLLP
jgi:hypothetical protein